jgi:hypothetical protein
MEGDIAEEGMDRGETNIAAAGGVAATLLEMIEELSNERSIQICQGQRRRDFAQLSLRMPEEQPESVAVACQGMATDLPFAA